jgi:hypothetical protein
MNTLIIGDVHGHYDRLEALLKQEGIIGECPECEGSGDGALEGGFCELCHGEGTRRLNKDVRVIQLGDLGHFGSGYSEGRMVPGSSSADLMCWDAAVCKDWVDVILWGNHDAAVVDETHTFTGYIKPPYETLHIMKGAAAEGRLKLAYEVDGFLLTKTDPAAMAQWLNGMQNKDETEGLGFGDPDEDRDFLAVRDAIGKKRGGPSPVGGILWRDATEKLYMEYRQIFGHSRGDKVRKYETPKGWSYCVDVGDQYNGHLAGIWLPDERIVEVKL